MKPQKFCFDQLIVSRAYVSINSYIKSYIPALQVVLFSLFMLRAYAPSQEPETAIPLRRSPSVENLQALSNLERLRLVIESRIRDNLESPEGRQQ